MGRGLVAAGVAGMLLGASIAIAGDTTSARGPAQRSAEVCASLDDSPAARARQLDPLGEAGRSALLALAGSTEPAEVLCGVAGLSALGDRRAIPHLVSALGNPRLRDEAYRLARWAAYLAGGPDGELGAAMVPVVEVLEDPGVWKAAGNDAIWLLGEIDHPSARDRLLAELDEPLDAAALDAVIHALARQGDPRARAAINRLGAEALQAKSGNATPEQAQRLGEVAFYQLALGPDSVADGFDTLDTIAVRDQTWVAAWSVHTLCARAVRRPGQREAIESHRRTLVEELDRRGIPWEEEHGTFGCAP